MDVDVAPHNGSNSEVGNLRPNKSTEIVGKDGEDVFAPSTSRGADVTYPIIKGKESEEDFYVRSDT